MALTPSQKKAAAHFGGNALILSGPGTGKTSTLIERSKLLVSKGVPLDSLFITTFTSKAASEIKGRLYHSMNKIDGDTSGEIAMKGAYIGTFHSLCARILKQYPGDAWLPHDFKIISDEDQKRILNTLGYEWDEDEGDFVELINKWKDQLLSPAKIQEQSSSFGSVFLEKAAQAYSDYETHRKSKSYVDFSDLILSTTKLLSNNSEGSEWFHDKFSHFIVDEFQDSNKNQLSFLKAALGKYGNIWAVADEDQSLYEWRGSSPTYCLNFEKIFPNTTIYKLEDNFRCPPLIVNMASALIKNNRKRYAKELRAAKAQKNSDLVIFKGFSHQKEEAKWIVEQIGKLSQMKNFTLNETCILIRTSHVANSIQRELELKNIPFRLIGTHSFWDLPEVDFFIKAISKIASDTRIDDGKAFTHSIIGKKLNTLIEEMKGSTIRQSARAISQILFEHTPKNIDAERKENWMQSVEAIQNIALDADDNDAFIELVIEKRQSIKRKDSEAVTITTMHSAKGLEWNNVFIMGCEEKIIPHFKNKNLEEERRLFYVALTRAKQRVFATYSYLRHNKPRKPSRFLFEAKSGADKKLGKFNWLDTNLNKNSNEKQVEENKPKSSPVVRVGKPMFKYKGGKSLIPPEERGK